jgi:hypothetical protein
VASTEVLADEHAQMIDDALGPRYPMDDVREMKNCELNQPMKNVSFKVAINTALPCLPEALHHGNPIPAGYARVLVDDIVSGYEDLDIDIPTPEGDVKLGDVKQNHSMAKEIHQVSRLSAKATDSEESKSILPR